MAKKKPPKLHKSQSAAEFKLLVEQFSEEISKRSGTAFLFRTSEHFQNFVYELVVEWERKDRKIFFKILGLKTPMKDFPRPGPVFCKCEIESLEQGDYTLVIDRRGKQVNEFKVSLRNGVKLLQSQKQDRFIDVTTDPNEWSYEAD